jgi:hypothetical protein
MLVLFIILLCAAPESWTFYLSLLERSSFAVSEVRFYFPYPDLVFIAAVFPVILSFLGQIGFSRP